MQTFICPENHMIGPIYQRLLPTYHRAVWQQVKRGLKIPEALILIFVYLEKKHSNKYQNFRGRRFTFHILFPELIPGSLDDSHASHTCAIC